MVWGSRVELQVLSNEKILEINFNLNLRRWKFLTIIYMTTAKGIFQVASNPEICQIFAKQFYTVSGMDAANLVDNQGGKLLWQW